MKKHLLMIAAILVSVAAVAQDGLYAPVLPDDIALVRVINALGRQPEANGETAEVTIDIGTTRIGPVAPGTGSTYHPVRPGVYVVFAAGTRQALTAGSGTFQTVIITPDGIAIIEDSHHDDPLRAQLVLYNLTSTPLRLDALVPSAPLIEAVEPWESGSIAINAILVTLAALPVDAPQDDGCNCETGAEASRRYRSEMLLTRGDSFAVVVTERESAFTGFVVIAGVSTGDE